MIALTSAYDSVEPENWTVDPTEVQVTPKVSHLHSLLASRACLHSFPWKWLHRLLAPTARHPSLNTMYEYAYAPLLQQRYRNTSHLLRWAWWCSPFSVHFYAHIDSTRATHVYSLCYVSFTAYKCMGTSTAFIPTTPLSLCTCVCTMSNDLNVTIYDRCRGRWTRSLTMYCPAPRASPASTTNLLRYTKYTFAK